MKILWLSHFAPYPPKGGASQRSYNMLKQLSKYADVSLLSLAPYSKIASFFNNYEAGMEEIEHELGKYCDEIRLIPHGRHKRQTAKTLNALKSLVRNDSYDVVCLESKELEKSLTKALAENNYDAIHLDTIGLWPYVANLDIPLILNHHNIESQMLQRRASKTSWPLSQYIRSQESKLQKLEIQAGAKARINVTCSRDDGQRLSEIGIDNVAEIPNGVDLSYFSRRQNYQATESGIDLIFAGGLEWYPNRDAMIFFAKKVWPQLKAKAQAATMTVVGRGSIPLLNDIAATDSSFKVAGFVPDVRTYLEQASIYVCPIRDGGGTKLKVLDALGMGIPLIAHPIACEGINVRNGEHVIFAETPKQFCDAILSLSADPELKMKLSANGRQLIEEQYCYNKIGEKMAKVYQLICS